MSERQLHQSVCDYLRYKYPKVMFNSDLSGSMKLTIGQASAMKRLRSNRAFPDLSIYYPNRGWHGCFVELKDGGEKLYNKKGELKTEHLKEQEACMVRLRELGYKAEFAIGIDQAIELIDRYLN